MRSMLLSFASLALLAACSPEAATAENATTEKALQLRTVYSEPADRPAPSTSSFGALYAAAEVEDTPPAATQVVGFETLGAPAGTDALAARLRARHVDQIPKAEDIQAIEQADTMLLFIEANASLMLERQRALSLMRHVYTPAVRARVLELAGNETTPVPVRSAALRTLLVAADVGDAEAAAVVAAAEQSPEVRIRAVVMDRSN